MTRAFEKLSASLTLLVLMHLTIGVPMALAVTTAPGNATNAVGTAGADALDKQAATKEDQAKKLRETGKEDDIKAAEVLEASAAADRINSASLRNSAASGAQQAHALGGGHSGGGGEQSSPPMMMPPPPPPPPPPSNPPPPPPPPASQPPPAPPAALGPAQNDDKNAALEKQIQEQKDLLAQMNSEKKEPSASAAKVQADAEIARIEQNRLLQAQKMANDYAAQMIAKQAAEGQSQTTTSTAQANQRVALAEKRTIAQRMNNASPVGIDLTSVPGQPGSARAFTGSTTASAPAAPSAMQGRGFDAPPPPALPAMKKLSASGGQDRGAASEREPSSETPFNLFGAASAADHDEPVRWSGQMIVPRSLSVALEANRAIVGGSSRLKRNVIPQP